MQHPAHDLIVIGTCLPAQQFRGR